MSEEISADRAAAFLRQAIAHHLRERGWKVEDSGTALRVEVGAIAMGVSASVYSKKPGPPSVMTEIEVTTTLAPADWGSVVQYHVGLEKSEGAALIQALHAWLDGVWPVIAALYDTAALNSLGRPITVTTTTGSAPPVSWRVLTGEPFIRCAGADSLEAVTAMVKRRAPMTYMGNAFADAVDQGRFRTDGAPNWGHYFAFRLNGKPNSHEATINGEPWIEGVRDLLELPWPHSDAFMTIRQFYVIQRVHDAS